ncbi:MAG: hypothetical protein IPM69_07340 [Ignavibacteria bacterium]|nr:hypothetical protein [Ignavibacteria bacterium]
MEQFMRASLPNFLAMLCIVTLIIAADVQKTSAQTVPPCTLPNCVGEQWSVATDLVIRHGDCLFKIRYYQKKCTQNGTDVYCDYYFDRIEAIHTECCYFVTWPTLAELVQGIAFSFVNYVPNLGCPVSPTGGYNIWFPSCWKIVTPNQVAEACFVLSCCRVYQSGVPGSTPVLMPLPTTPDCVNDPGGEPTCVNICQ